ncbi:MAG: hypothetical protein PHV28_08725 [Kiritimatiellae bacterium]|nr:hypothetical protein [Kiritimatiellia bacterium]
MKQASVSVFFHILSAAFLWPAAAGAFEPTNLTGCVMWLQAGAANIQTNNAEGQVSQWSDLSGNGNHAVQTNTLSKQPLYQAAGPGGLPTIFFPESSRAGLTTETSLTSAYSVFIVTRVLDLGELGITWRRLLPSRDANWFLGTYTPGTFCAYMGNAYLTGPKTFLRSSYQFNRTYTLAAVNTGASQRFYVNGFDLSVNTSAKTAPGRLAIGGAGASNDPSDAQISEVIAYNRALSEEERQQVETYLAGRYGVTTEGFLGSVWKSTVRSGLWSEGANWEQALPAAPMLGFNATQPTVSTNDLTGLTLDGVMVWDFDGHFSGNPVTLNNGFFCNALSAVTWGLDTALPAGLHTFSVLTAKRLTLSGVLSGEGGLLLGLGMDHAGTLALTCPTNTFTGAALLQGGIAEITRLADAGQPSSLGAASGTNAIVQLGNRRLSHNGGIRYVGTETSATDRPLKIVRFGAIENASPTAAGMTFNGAITGWNIPGGGNATLTLTGTSGGTSTFNGSLDNPLYVNVKSGVWAFTAPGAYTGGITIEGGTVLVNGTSDGCLGAGKIKLMSGATLGGTGLVYSAGGILMYPGAIIAPGDPSANNGVGCLTFGLVPDLSGVRLRCQTEAATNDSLRVNAALPLPAFMTVEIVADSAAACPDTLRIIQAASLSGVTDLSGWDIEAPCTYRAAIEGNAVVLHKEAGTWLRSMPIRFGGYAGASVLTNFPALVKLWDGCGNNRFHYRDGLPDGADLLFTDEGGMALQHEIEMWNTNGESHVWVQIPALVRGTQITACWKNPALAPDGSLFVPTSLPGCGLWLHAGAGLTTNGSGSVSVWADQSGHGHDATQATSGAQPTWVADAVNGLPAVRFEASGTKDGMATGWSAATSNAYTVFVAGTFRKASGYAWRRILQGSAGYNWGIAVQELGKFYTFVPNGASHTLLATPDLRVAVGVPFVGSVTANGTNSFFSLNGFAYPSVAATGTPNILCLGAVGYIGDGWDGDILEVIGYDRALSFEERRQVERYLAVKYDALSAHRVPAVGLQQWLRGDSMTADVLDGATPRVSKCENQTQTVGLHATQATTNRMPEWVAASFNNKPALRFDAVEGQYDSLRSAATNVGTAYSVVAVYGIRSTGAFERVVMQGVGGVSRLSVTNGLVTRRANAVVSQLLPCPTNTPVIAAMTCDGAASRFYVNGVNLTQSGTPVGAWGTGGGGSGSVFYFGAATGDGALDLPLDGDLAEVLVYNRIISDNERRRIETYLSDRYAIPVDRSNARVWSGGFGGVWHLTGTGRLLLADSSPTQTGAVLLGQPEPLPENAFAGQGLAWGSGAQLGRSRPPPASAPKTYSFWVKQQTPVADQAVVLAGTNGQPYAALNNAGGKLAVAGTDAAALAEPFTGAWAHYAVAVNADGSVQAYGNGLPLATVASALAASMPTNQPLTFGHATDAADASKTFSGVLDEVRVESVTRGADWIRAAYMTQAENAVFTSYNRWGSLMLMR